ncbi:MAG: DUF4411 family protein [Spirochaetaceae bacterium]|nr:MAG: DUF4411 family protein [Spirochaetaceae bacterium]
MPKYCLDSNIVIESKNKAYAFDIVPSFWDWIDLQVGQENIYTTITVYDELTQGNDDLEKWIKARKSSEMFIEPDVNVQNQFAKIADFINDRYDISEVRPFLGCADPCVI